MAWQGILGHDRIVERFQRAALRRRSAGSFLFVGSAGIGKRSFAVALAKTLLCKNPPSWSVPGKFLPCDDCESCRLFPSQGPVVHPDFFLIRKPADRTTLPLELIVGDKEHRGKAGLCFEISRTPYLGGKKVAVIDDADLFKAEAANALLKTLEEPPPDSLLILLGSSAAKQLPTIRSRCQLIRFHPLSPQNLATILYEQEVVDSMEAGLRLAKRAGGSLETAQGLLDGSLETSREEVLQQFAVKRFNAVATAEIVNAAVDAEGKDDAPTRRRRLRYFLTAVVEFFRTEMRNAEKHGFSSVPFFRRIELTLDALEQIDRNANMPYIVDHWTHALVGTQPSQNP